jgi:MoxR-like ATPase
MLESLGIFGWEEAEPVVLAAMSCKYPVMLMGSHGAAKTDGAQALVKSVLGADADFQQYDVPTLQADDLLGYPNPADLAAGRPMRYVPTPVSVWNKKGILLDELNRASFMIQSKLIELVRTRTVMGMPTDVEYVFAAVNPPETYGSVYMDLAFAARFATVRVPDLGVLSDEHLGLILQQGLQRTNGDLVGFIEKVSEAKLPQEDRDELRELVKKIAKALQSQLSTQPNAPGYSARSMVMLYNLLEASEKLRRLSVDYAQLMNEHTLPNLILSTVPEVWGLTQKSADKNILTTKINELLAGFRLGNAITSTTDIEDLLEMDLTNEDVLAWSVNVNTKIKEVRHVQKMKRVATLVLQKRSELPETIANSILRATLLHTKVLNMVSLDVPFTEEGMLQVIIDSFYL